jgi:hypothetical protein
VLDNHDLHLPVEELDYCKQNGVTLLSFPPHCSHKLQPLDVSVCGPLKTYCACDAWVTYHPGHTLTVYDIPVIVNSFLHLAASGIFGIYPFNMDIFHDEEFMGAYVTDRSTLPVVAVAFNSKDVDLFSRTISVYF